jgi:hypothetical protein
LTFTQNPVDITINGGADIFSYTVQQYKVSAVSAPILIEQQAISVSSGQTSFEAKFYNYATQNNEQYFIKVFSNNRDGQSATHIESNSIVPHASPSTVTSVVVEPYDGKINIEWQPPLYTNGSTSYTYTIKNLTNNTTFSGITGHFYNVTGLANATTYSFELYADNGLDVNYNKYNFSAKPADVPTAISGMTSYVSNGNLTLDWRATPVATPITKFYIVLHDLTIDHMKLIDLKLTDATLSNSNVYDYKFVINKYTTQISNLLPTDQMKIVVYSMNSAGMSNPSNPITIN